MRFAESQRLLGLVIVGVGMIVTLAIESRRSGRAAQWISPALWRRVIPGWIAGRRMRRALLAWLTVALAIVALARPQWGTRVEVTPVSGLDVMIVLDLSNSMETEDVPPSRLSRAKHWVRSLVEKLDGDRIGLVAFAASAHVLVPLTLDTAYVLDQLAIVSPKMVTNQGTDIGLGLEVALTALGRGAENSLQKGADVSQASHAVVLITDGEDFEAQAQTTAKELANRGVAFSVIGVGTQKGGPIPVTDDSGARLTYKKDSKGQPVLSTFHPETLVELARAAKGNYYNLSGEEAEIQDILASLGKLQRGDLAQRKLVIHEDRYQWPLALAVLLFLMQLSVPVSRRIALLGVAILLQSGSVQAASPVSSIDAYLENRRGLESLEQKQTMEATEHFGRAQAQDPDRPEFDFNQGVAAATKGDAGEAARLFNEAARKAEKLAPGPRERMQSLSLYNRSVAESKAGLMDQAARSYVDAIRAAQAAGESEVEARARKNLELLAQQDEQQKQKKQQEEKEQQDQQKQDQEQSGQKDQQKEEGKEKDAQEKENGEKRPPPDGSLRPKPKPFKSEKLTPEDAERVMQELSNKEKQLQERLRRGGRKGQSRSNDW